MENDPVREFAEQNRRDIEAQGRDEALIKASRDWMHQAYPYRYAYHFTWLGRPIIQFPQDIVALQEIIWSTQPDIVVETGVAHGGSAVLAASMLELLGGERFVVSVDIDIRKHNREAIEAHPLSKRIRLVQGSSTAPETVAAVRRLVGGARRVMVLLDSNHTHDHVLKELQLYSPLIGAGQYLIVYDTSIELAPAGLITDKPWRPGQSPMTAVTEFLETNHRFEQDASWEQKLLVTVAPGGYLRCLRDL